MRFCPKCYFDLENDLIPGYEHLCIMPLQPRSSLEHELFLIALATRQQRAPGVWRVVLPADDYDRFVDGIPARRMDHRSEEQEVHFFYHGVMFLPMARP